jgi:hypothetical protein
MESCVRSTLILINGVAALVLRLFQRLVLAFAISDFGMRFCGYWRATFVRSAFTGSIGGRLMACAE